MDNVKKELAKWSQRAGFVLVGMLVLIGALAVPIGVSDIGSTLTRRIDDEHRFLLLTPEQELPSSGYFEAQIVSLNDIDQTMTVRLTGLQECATDCGYKQRIVFYSLRSDSERDDYPEFAAFTLSPNVATNDTLKLPYHSDIYHYPFDRNSLVFGLAVERTLPDNTIVRLPADQVRREMYVQLENVAPRMTMTRPTPVDPKIVQSPRISSEYAYVGTMTLERPLYLRLSIFFVLVFMTALVAYVVLLRPWDSIVTVVAGLVLATWGLRALILGSIPGDYTFVETYLIALVSFALFVPVARGLSVLHLGGELRVPGFATKKADDTRKCPECESDISKTAHRCRFCTAYVTPEVVVPPDDATPSPPEVTVPSVISPPALPPAPPGTCTARNVPRPAAFFAVSVERQPRNSAVQYRNVVARAA